MSGFCDRCNEKSSQLVHIAHLPELAAVEHLGYRSVCTPCYDDLLAEASEALPDDEDRRAEPRAAVTLRARVEGNTSHLQPFAEEMIVEEISPSGLRLRTTRDVEAGAILKVSVPSHAIETTALVEVVWREDDQRRLGLKLVEPNEAWNRLWQESLD